MPRASGYPGRDDCPDIDALASLNRLAGLCDPGRRSRDCCSASPCSLLRIIAQLIAEGHARAVVGKTFPLDEARQAHELSQSGYGRGHIVLLIVD